MVSGTGFGPWPQTQQSPSPVNPNVGTPQQGTRGKKSDQRFRSFAERYMVARCHLFRTDMSEHTEDQWACILDAKRAYKMIEAVGMNIEPEDGAF
jgi:hypothetical protein